MLKSTTDDRWLGLRPPQPDGRWWWWFIFDFVHNLTTWPHLRTPPACFLVWPNNILNKERQCWAWCGVKQRTEKLPDCSDARSRCQWSQDPHCTVQYSTVQNSTVHDPHCLRSGVHQVHDCFSIGQTRALDSSSFALELCTKLELVKLKFILNHFLTRKWPCVSLIRSENHSIIFVYSVTKHHWHSLISGAAAGSQLSLGHGGWGKKIFPPLPRKNK